MTKRNTTLEPQGQNEQRRSKMIPYGRHHIDESDVEAVSRLLREGMLTQGPMVAAFEDAVANYTGAKYAVAVSSGTAGLHLAAVVAGVTKDKSLLTSPVTFVASANAAHYAGGAARFVDIDASTVNMATQSLETALTENPEVRAVIPVHYAGLACNMSEISRIARSAGICVIEDAAHALGGRYDDGSIIGNNRFADMTVFSFHPVKAVAAGEGGVVTTNNEDYYRHLLRIRSHGIGKAEDPISIQDQAFDDGKPNPWYYEMVELGYHYRITDIQCALALSQFRKLDQFVTRRRQLAMAYDRAFKDFKNLRPAQPEKSRDRSGHHIYVLRISFDRLRVSRGDLMRALRDRGIGTQVHYIPVPCHPFYRELGHNPAAYPEAMHFYQEALSIPLFFDLRDEDQQKVVRAFQELVG